MKAIALLKPIALTICMNCMITHVLAQQQPDTLLKKATAPLSLQAKKRADAISGLLKEGTASINIPSDSVMAGKLVSFGKERLQPVAAAGKQLLSQAVALTKLFDKGELIKANKLEFNIDYNYIEDTSTMNLGGYQGPLQNNMAYNIGFGSAVTNLPFAIAFAGNNSNYTPDHTNPSTLSKLNFDHKKYIEDIKSKVLQKINPEVIAASTINRLNNIKAGYRQLLNNDIKQLQTSLVENYKQQLNLPADITDLDVTDLSSLKNKIMPTDAVEKYKISIDRIQEIIKNTDPKDLQNNTEYQALQGNIKKFESLEKVYSKVVYWKERFNNNKIVKALRTHLPFTSGNFKSYLNDPRNLNSVLKEHASLSSIQSFFTKVTKFDFGQNAVQGGQFDVSSLINTGINTEFKSDKLSLGFIAGKNNNVNNWLQVGLINTASTEYSKLTGIKVGTGNNAAISNALSLNIFEFAATPGNQDINNIMQPAYLPVTPHKDAVIGLQTSWPVAPNHTVTLDLSKSFGIYQSNNEVDSAMGKNNPLSSLFNNNGSSNYAAMVGYTGEIKETSVDITIKKVGLGYSNPGNAFLRKGESQYGISLARKFMKNKLSVKYSADYRNQHFDPAKNYTYTSFSNKAQVNYRVNRDTRLKIAYQQSASTMKLYEESATNGKNSRLQLDGSFRFKLKGIKINNNSGLGMSRITLPLLTGGDTYKNTSYNIMHTSSAVLGKNIMSLSIFASQSDNKEYYFNTSMMNVETNYSYMVFKTIRMGSGIGYYENAGWNKQLGAKQQLSATLIQKLAVDIELGYKKAIKIYRQELADQLYMNAGLRYNF